MEDAAVVLVHHGQGSVEQVAQVVGQVGINAGDEAITAEVAVLSQLDIIQEIVTDGIGAEFAEQRNGINDIALRLGHLFAVHNEPAMSINLFRQFDAKAHEHDGPDNGMETDDFLPYQMDISRPEFLEFSGSSTMPAAVR